MKILKFYYYLKMLKLSTFSIIFKEMLTTKRFDREPEPDLIMEDKEQVEAFTLAGEIGTLAPVYFYHIEKATPTLHGAKTVLDLGCGSGFFLNEMAKINPDIQFIGYDLSDLMLETAKKAINSQGLKNVKLRKGDFTDLSAFADKSVDGIMSLQALHHLPSIEHLEKLYSEIGRVIKPDGAIYIQDFIRLKNRESVLHFAYYDLETPYLTQIDGERSMMAAFLFIEFQALAKKYLPENLRNYKTAFADLFMVQKTPDRKLQPETQSRLESNLSTMSKEARSIYSDIRLFLRLGGLK